MESRNNRGTTTAEIYQAMTSPMDLNPVYVAYVKFNIILENTRQAYLALQTNSNSNLISMYDAALYLLTKECLIKTNDRSISLEIPKDAVSMVTNIYDLKSIAAAFRLVDGLRVRNAESKEDKPLTLTFEIKNSTAALQRLVELLFDRIIIRDKSHTAQHEDPQVGVDSRVYRKM